MITRIVQCNLPGNLIIQHHRTKTLYAYESVNYPIVTFNVWARGKMAGLKKPQSDEIFPAKAALLQYGNIFTN